MRSPRGGCSARPRSVAWGSRARPALPGSGPQAPLPRLLCPHDERGLVCGPFWLLSAVGWTWIHCSESVFPPLIIYVKLRNRNCSVWPFLGRQSQTAASLGFPELCSVFKSSSVSGVISQGAHRPHQDCSVRDLGSIPGLGGSPGEGSSSPTPVLWPGDSHGLYRPWGCRGSDTAEQLSPSGP